MVNLNTMQSQSNIQFPFYGNSYWYEIWHDILFIYLCLYVFAYLLLLCTNVFVYNCIARQGMWDRIWFPGFNLSSSSLGQQGFTRDMKVFVASDQCDKRCGIRLKCGHSPHRETDRSAVLTSSTAGHKQSHGLDPDGGYLCWEHNSLMVTVPCFG